MSCTNGRAFASRSYLMLKSPTMLVGLVLNDRNAVLEFRIHDRLRIYIRLLFIALSLVHCNPSVSQSVHTYL